MQNPGVCQVPGMSQVMTTVECKTLLNMNLTENNKITQMMKLYYEEVLKPRKVQVKKDEHEYKKKLQYQESV